MDYFLINNKIELIIISILFLYNETYSL